MKNVQITKSAAVANVAAVAPKARTVRPAQKPVAKAAESVVVKSAKIIGAKYQIVMGRPAAGRMLKAYTHAALELLGMFNGQAHDRATLNKVFGATAVNYHTKQTGAFCDSADGIMLTPSFGPEFFNLRADLGEFDRQDVEDFKKVLVGGKPDGRLVKSANAVKPM